MRSALRLPIGVLTLFGWLNCSATCDRTYQCQAISFADFGIKTIFEPDVFVVDIDIHEPMDLALRGNLVSNSGIPGV